MIFNWLLASYAHVDWLGPWTRLLEARDAVDMRLLRRVSLALVEHHGLQHRYLHTAQEFPWVLLPLTEVLPLAQELGVAMLGGWVRTHLEREHVAEQRQVLTAEQRTSAMRHATLLKALPYPHHPLGWPLVRLDPEAVIELGVSCMAAVLDDSSTGSRERFSMRFARGLVVPVALTKAQRTEALEVMQWHSAGAQDLPSSGSPLEFARLRPVQEMHA